MTTPSPSPLIESIPPTSTTFLITEPYSTIITIVSALVALGSIAIWIYKIVTRKKDVIVDRAIADAILKADENKVTEQELKEKKNKLRKLEDEFNKKYKSLKNELPLLADTIMLQNSLRQEKEQLYENIKQIESIKNKLDQYEETAGKDVDELINQANSLLSTNFHTEKRVERLYSNFNKFTFIFALLNNVLYGFLRDILGYLYVISFLCIAVAGYFIKRKGEGIKNRVRQNLKLLLSGSTISIVISFVLIGFADGFFEYYSFYDSLMIIAFSLLFLGTILFISFAIAFLVLRKKYTLKVADFIRIKIFRKSENKITKK